MNRFKWLLVFFFLNITCSYVIAKDNDWTQYYIPNIMSIYIPESMELQGPSFKELKNKYLNELYIDLSLLNINKNEFVFQQAGLNDMTPASFKTFARIIISYEIGEDEGFGPIIYDYEISNADLIEIDSTIKSWIQTDLESSGSNLVEWYGTKLIQKKFFSVVQSSFLREAVKNKPVYVERYAIFNGNKIIEIVVSCRKSEKDTVFSELWQIVDTIVLR